MTTDDFLNSLDYDQLNYCRRKAEELIKRKDDETKVALWVVADEDINYAWFREDDYDAAVDRMVREIREEAAREKPVKHVSMAFYLTKHRFHESEVAALLDASR